VGLQYRCPKFVRNVDLPSADNKCFICGGILTNNLGMDDSSNNGVCHGIRCVKKSKTARHSFFGRLLRKLISQAGFPLVGHETSILKLVGPENFRGNMANFSKLRVDFVTNIVGAQYAFDQSIIHVTRTDDLVMSLQRAVTVKNNKYGKLLSATSTKFVPLVITALGYTSPEFDEFISWIKGLALANGRKINLEPFYSSLSSMLAGFAGGYMARSCFGLKF
jgi:hypothetical protein